MRKHINWLRHLSILVLTIIIFILGIFIGINVEQMRVSTLYTQLQEQELSYQTLITESNYINYIVSLKGQSDEVSCDIIKRLYYTSIHNLDESRIKLENYENAGRVKVEEYKRLKKHYANVQITYWMLANKINSICKENMNTILFFYAEKKICPSCEDQGIHLSYVKQKLKDDVLIFSFDALNEGASRLLMQKYDIRLKDLPVLIINEQKYNYSTNSEIFKILCNNGIKNSVCVRQNI